MEKNNSDKGELLIPFSMAYISSWNQWSFVVVQALPCLARLDEMNQEFSLEKE